MCSEGIQNDEMERAMSRKWKERIVENRKSEGMDEERAKRWKGKE
jgi:hypothetical protein